MAQAWPAKPIRFLVPYPVGGIVDIVTRSLADPMQADLGQPVVVEPKPGGNSTLATALIPRASADGYNWVMAIKNSVSSRVFGSRRQFVHERDWSPVADRV